VIGGSVGVIRLETAANTGNEREQRMDEKKTFENFMIAIADWWFEEGR